MAKKDFKSKIANSNARTTTQSFFSAETLNKAEEKQEEQQEKAKRSYTKFASKENKTHTISLRLTDREFNDLIAKVNKSESGTITNYLMQLIKRGK